MFSPLTAKHELRAAEVLAEIGPQASITLSHQLGRIDLLERENVTLLNACLADLGRHVIGAFREALGAVGIHAPFYLTQNDGTVMLAKVAAHFPVFSFSSGPTNSVLQRIREMLEESIDRMKTQAADTTLVAVGGGAFLIPEQLAGCGRVLRAENAAVANAVGAAIAQVSGESDQVFTGLTREQAMDRARELAEERAVAAGADSGTLKLVDIEDLPIAYLPGNSMRVRARVIGDIANPVPAARAVKS